MNELLAFNIESKRVNFIEGSYNYSEIFVNHIKDIVARINRIFELGGSYKPDF